MSLFAGQTVKLETGSGTFAECVETKKKACDGYSVEAACLMPWLVVEDIGN